MIRQLSLWIAGGLACLWAVVLSPSASAQEVNPAVLSAQQQRIAGIARGVRSAVAVFSADGNGGGSGVVISPDGYALTNFHVVQPCGDYMKCSMADGKLYDAVLVGIDPVGDVAIIKLLGRDDFPPATLADSDQVRVGDWCFAVGNPFLLATDFQPTVTYGIVSGVHRYQEPAGTLLEYADCIQTDAAINPGNSGGPLYNAAGELIGVNGRGSFEKRGRVNVGVGYAISINQIKHFMGCLKSGRIVDHATAGFTVVAGEDGKVRVADILESSDAYRRGLRYDDEILAFGGRRATSVNAFKNVLGIFPKGWRVPISFKHEGQLFETHVRLTGVHAEEELLDKVQKRADAKARPQPKGKAPEPKGKNPPGEEPKPAPMPAPMPKGKAKLEPPPEAAKLIEPRRGFANFYFNQLERDRVWKRFTTAQGDFSQAAVWKLKGKATPGGKVEVTLREDAAGGEFTAGPELLDLAKDLDEQRGPSGSGGLLLAMHLWRMLLVGGPPKFGEVQYYGTAPHPALAVPADLLTGIHQTVESRWTFHPETGALAVLEVIPDPREDACEILFRDYREVAGRKLPFRWRVTFGDHLYGEIEWEEITLTAAPGEKK